MPNPMSPFPARCDPRCSVAFSPPEGVGETAVGSGMLIQPVAPQEHGFSSNAARSRVASLCA